MNEFLLPGGKEERGGSRCFDVNGYLNLSYNLFQFKNNGLYLYDGRRVHASLLSALARLLPQDVLKFDTGELDGLRDPPPGPEQIPIDCAHLFCRI